MRLLIASDIHLEHGFTNRIPELPPEDSYDFVLLVGDIGVSTQAIDWALGFFPKHKNVYYTPGNHEFYRQNMQLTLERMREKCIGTNITLMAPGVQALDTNYVLIGATLWTDLKLQNYYPEADQVYEWGIADFSLIQYETELFSADHVRALYEAERTFIDRQVEIARAHDFTPIVMTHFVPTQEAIAPQYLGDRLTPYFINDCDDLMKKHKLPIWIFGHSHVRLDFNHSKHGTRIVSNAFGYPGEMDYPEWKIVQL